MPRSSSDVFDEAHRVYNQLRRKHKHDVPNDGTYVQQDDSDDVLLEGDGDDAQQDDDSQQDDSDDAQQDAYDSHDDVLESDGDDAQQELIDEFDEYMLEVHGVPVQQEDGETVQQEDSDDVQQDVPNDDVDDVHQEYNDDDVIKLRKSWGYSETVQQDSPQLEVATEFPLSQIEEDEGQQLEKKMLDATKTIQHFIKGDWREHTSGAF